MTSLLPQEFIDQVKSKVDMLELASQYTTMKPVGAGVYGGLCPHPDHDDDNPSFTVFAKDNSWCCYGCHHGKKAEGGRFLDKNYGSDCFAFIQWLSKGQIGWRQAVFLLAEEYGVPLPDDPNSELYQSNFNKAKSFHDNLMKHKHVLHYLRTRGLDEKDLKEWGIGYDGQKITFPLFDAYKRVIGFTKRWLNPPEGCRDKYRNSPTSAIFNKSSYFYGIHLIDKEHPYVYITEGTMDVILAHKYGMKNVLAVLGTSFTEEHVQALKKLEKIPVLVLDGDAAGLKSMNKIIDLLSNNDIYCKIVVLPNNDDLADISLSQQSNLPDFIEKQAMTYGYYKMHGLINHYLSKLTEIRIQALPGFKEVLKEVPKEEQALLRNLIEELTQIKI